jgi:transcriptional regulator of PTS gene
MVETEAWHYLSVRISRGEIHLSLRDLSSKLVVEEQLELALTDSTPFLTRLSTISIVLYSPPKEAGTS